MKLFIPAFLLCVIFSLAGCASADKFLGSTEASYEEGKWFYKSNKNQENLDAALGYDEKGRPIVKLKTTATTPEAAMAAAAQASAEAWKNFSEFMKELLPLIKKGAAAGS